MLTVQIRLVQTNIESGPPLWEKYRWNSSTIQDAQWTFGCNCWGHESQLHTIVKSQKTTLSSSSSGWNKPRDYQTKYFYSCLATLGWRYLATVCRGGLFWWKPKPIPDRGHLAVLGDLSWSVRPSKAWRQTNHQNETQTGHHLEVYILHLEAFSPGKSVCTLGSTVVCDSNPLSACNPLIATYASPTTPRTPNPDSKSARNRSGRNPVVDSCSVLSGT